MSLWSAASAICASAPSLSPCCPNSILPRLLALSALMSITLRGCITLSRIRSINVVPPASNCVGALMSASRSEPRHTCARTADWALSSREYWNGCMLGLLHQRLGLLDGVDDVRVGGAAAQIAAHVFADVGVGF